MPSESAPEPYVLLPHPVSHSADNLGAVSDFSVTVRRSAPSRLGLIFSLRADLDSLELPRPRPPARADGLWRHTCFEVFVLRAGGLEYREFNFAPSGAWAAYHFTSYRTGMAALADTPARANWRSDGNSLELDVVLDSGWFVGESPGAALRVGCSAVIESRTGSLSYWALRHPSGTPDFHNADGFAVELG